MRRSFKTPGRSSTHAVPTSASLIFRRLRGQRRNCSKRCMPSSVTSSMRSDRASFLRAAAAGALAAGWQPGIAGAAIERPSLTIGTAVDSPAQLPLYLAAARTFKEQGLDVKVLGFRGDAEVAQALAGG